MAPPERRWRQRCAGQQGGWPAAAARRRHRHRAGSEGGAAKLPYAIVLGGMLGGLLWVRLSETHVKGGVLLIAGSLLFGGAARLVLAGERVGLLANRRRGLDVAALTAVGIGLLVAALLIPSPS